MKTIPTFGYAIGIAGANAGCAMGPVELQDPAPWEHSALALKWEPIIYAHGHEEHLAVIPTIAQSCEKLASLSYQYANQKQPFISFGGDHSCAIGTWSGASTSLDTQGEELGLIWIDAHMDAHTPQTSTTGNPHGMPLAALLGYGDAALTEVFSEIKKLKPENIVLIGIRSYEEGEKNLLDKLGVRIYYMDEVSERSFAVVMQEALNIVQKKTAGFGISIDIDGIDPSDAPGTGMHESGGIKAEDLCQALKQIKPKAPFIGIEFAEFDPNCDQNNKTQQLIVRLVEAVFL